LSIRVSLAATQRTRLLKQEALLVDEGRRDRLNLITKNLDNFKFCSPYAFSSKESRHGKVMARISPCPPVILQSSVLGPTRTDILFIARRFRIMKVDKA
jgi:hypothetical protein